VVAAAGAWELLRPHEGSHVADQDHAVGTAQTRSEMIVLFKTRDDSDRL